MPVIKDADKITKLASESGRISEENQQYFQDHSEELAEEHSGEIIAIIGGEVAAAKDIGEDTDELREFFNGLRKQYSDAKVREAYIVRVPEPDQTFIL